MADDTNWTQEKSLTFSDALMMTWTAFSLASKVSAASLAGWWGNGATVSMKAMDRANASVDTGSARLKLRFSHMVVTLEITKVT
jgi:hypothetical protein